MGGTPSKQHGETCASSMLVLPVPPLPRLESVSDAGRQQRWLHRPCSAARKRPICPHDSPAPL